MRIYKTYQYIGAARGLIYFSLSPLRVPTPLHLNYPYRSTPQRCKSYDMEQLK